MADAAATPTVAIPDPGAYIVARWEELSSGDPPWWTRTSGFGYRLRLLELSQLARAREERSIGKHTIEPLKKEAITVLTKEGSYCRKRFGGLSQFMSELLDPEDSELHPSSQAVSIVDAGLAHLDEGGMIETILTDLAQLAAVVKDPKDFKGIDELVDLLDAELAFEGFSTAWRLDRCLEVREAVGAGKSLEQAFKLVTERLDTDQPRGFEALVPILELARPEAPPEVTLEELGAEQAEEKVLEDWQQEALLAEVSFESGALRFPLQAGADGSYGARDLAKAAEIVRELVARVSDLWRLQGGRLRVAEAMLIFDVENQAAEAAETEMPLPLLPEGLGRWGSDLTRQTIYSAPTTLESGRFADALIQLSQARTASPAAALTDLWTVVEATFAGGSDEPRYQAGEILGIVARWTAIVDRLDWLAERIDGTEAAGEYASTDGAPREWLAKRVDAEGTKILAELAESDPLAWSRLDQAIAWRRKNALKNWMRDLSGWVERIAIRAYLVRNFVVHSARPSRAPALSVTLPVFAALVRMSMSFVARVGSEASSLTIASSAGIQAYQAAADYPGDDKSMTALVTHLARSEKLLGTPSAAGS